MDIFTFVLPVVVVQDDELNAENFGIKIGIYKQNYEDLYSFRLNGFHHIHHYVSIYSMILAFVAVGIIMYCIKTKMCYRLHAEIARDANGNFN